jgi:hypothetical protein
LAELTLHLPDWRYAVHAINTVLTVFVVNVNGKREATATLNKVVDLMTLMTRTNADITNLRPFDPGDMTMSGNCMAPGS